MTGGGYYCMKLSRRLGPDQPFYAVPPADVTEWRELPSVETMADRHLRAIRAVRPHGPYIIGGFCLGGLIAHAIARQLEAEDETVERLLLIDATARNRRPQAVAAHGRTAWPLAGLGPGEAALPVLPMALPGGAVQPLAGDGCPRAVRHCAASSGRHRVAGARAVFPPRRRPKNRCPAARRWTLRRGTGVARARTAPGSIRGGTCRWCFCGPRAATR